MRISDWSSDVCSSDLVHWGGGRGVDGATARRARRDGRRGDVAGPARRQHRQACAVPDDAADLRVRVVAVARARSDCVQLSSGTFSVWPTCSTEPLMPLALRSAEMLVL